MNIKNLFLRYTLLFLGLNFLALYLGVLVMDNAPLKDWYLSLQKAPWTPINWLFGVAWSFIMICFAPYMAHLIIRKKSLKIWVLFGAQWLLNVGWNLVFFNQHHILGGAIVIVLLLLLILYFMIAFKSEAKLKQLLIVPYFIWMCIATSLNWYILFNN